MLRKDKIDNNLTMDLKNMPNHIAVIVDGNRRWAKENGLNDNIGHQKGAENIKNLCQWCIKYNIKYLTLYCLSVENLHRSKEELNFLFQLLKDNFSQKVIDDCHKNDVNINFIGDKQLLHDDLIEIVNNVENNKLQNPKLQLQICFCYSGRNEIVNAVKNILQDNQKNNINIDDIDEKFIEQHLFTKDIPDVDLMIRTGGDLRISNFLLWKLSYAELYFCNTYFPAFSENDFILALNDFQRRKRRYGK